MNVNQSRTLESSQRLSAWGETFIKERALFGAILSDPSTYDGLRDLIAPGDFSTGLHERFFEALPRVTNSDGSIDRSALRTALGVYAWDAEGGIDAWLNRLQAEQVTAAEAVRFARAISSGAERRRNAPEPIDLDTVAWCQHQATLLGSLAERSDSLSRQVDWQHIIEELLYVGRSQTGGVVRKIELVFEHLLKLISDPNAPSRNRWRAEIEAFRMRIAKEMKPSMHQLIDLDAAWQKGIADAARDLEEYAVRLPRDLPKTCPFKFEDLTAPTATMATLLEKLAAAGDMTSTHTARENQ